MRLDGADVGIFRHICHSGFAIFRFRCTLLLHKRFGRPHGKTVFNHQHRKLDGIVTAQQRARMPHAKLFFGHKVAKRRWQIQQAHHVCDMAAGLVHQISQFSRAVPKKFSQFFIRLCLFDRVQVLPLDIFKKRNFDRFCIIKISNDCGQIVQLRALGRAPTALTRYNLISALKGPHNDGLNNPVPRNTCGQFIQLLIGKNAAVAGWDWDECR